MGSGTGEHVVGFAKALPRLVWLPSDPDEASRTSIEAWMTSEGLANVRAPVTIDVREEVWGVEDDAPFDAIISLNTVHIAPWEARSVMQERRARPIPDCGSQPRRRPIAKPWLHYVPFGS